MRLAQAGRKGNSATPGAYPKKPIMESRTMQAIEQFESDVSATKLIFSEYQKEYGPLKELDNVLTRIINGLILLYED